jgi:zinc protease
LKRNAASFLLILILLSALVCSGAERLDIKEHTLPNGMRVLTLEDHSAPLVTVQVWVDVGSGKDPGGMSGLAHLIEHMMFKGTARMGAEEFSEIIQRYGGSENAGTGRDFTSYFAYVPSSRAEVAVSLWADIMAGAAFDPDEFLSERDVVLEELRLGLNDPYEAVFDEVTSLSYSAHPYGTPVIGWISDVSKVSRDMAYEHYKRYYVPGNMTVVIVGDITGNRALELASEYFGKMKKAPVPPEIPTEEPEQTGERRVKVKREALLPMVTAVWHIPGVEDPDLLVLQVIAQILGGGESSRLHKELVYEKQMCSSINAWAYSLLDPGLFYITGMMSSGHTTEEAEGAVYEILERLKTEPVEKRELEKAVNQYVSSFVFGQESVIRQAFVVGYYDAMYSYDMVNKMPELVRAVTPQDIIRVANKYFTEDNRTVATLVPLPVTEPEKLMRGMGGQMPQGMRR